MDPVSIVTKLSNAEISGLNDGNKVSARGAASCSTIIATPKIFRTIETKLMPEMVARSAKVWT